MFRVVASELCIASRSPAFSRKESRGRYCILARAPFAPPCLSVVDWFLTAMPDRDFPILPTTTIAALLDRYPHLEDVLIGLAPPFKKLKNPLLRRGVARVASLRHAAAVGGMSVDALVNTLRAAVGQSPIDPDD